MSLLHDNLVECFYLWKVQWSRHISTDSANFIVNFTQFLYIITDYLKGHIDSSSKDYDDLYEEAEQESQKILNHACAMGTLKDLYNDTWEKIKDTLPDDTNLYNPVNQQEDL